MAAPGAPVVVATEQQRRQYASGDSGGPAAEFIFNRSPGPQERTKQSLRLLKKGRCPVAQEGDHLETQLRSTIELGIGKLVEPAGGVSLREGCESPMRVVGVARRAPIAVPRVAAEVDEAGIAIAALLDLDKGRPNQPVRCQRTPFRTKPRGRKISSTSFVRSFSARLRVVGSSAAFHDLMAFLSASSIVLSVFSTSWRPLTRVEWQRQQTGGERHGQEFAGRAWSTAADLDPLPGEVQSRFARRLDRARIRLFSQGYSCIGNDDER